LLPDDLTQRFSPIACPVPLEQQPLNEYRELLESGFFQWGTMELPAYLRKLAWSWSWSWAIAGPVAAASFSPSKHPLPFLWIGSAGASLFLVLMLVRLYVGWSYINSRLSNDTVFYEESGWYDGQVWSKPLEVQTQDKLVVTYQVQPVLRRLHLTFAGLAIALLLGGVTWFLL
jgi:Conserved in the green lineage and diatoms 27